ncbi:hypothetical protein [Rhodoferax fermentans]|uniref:hypothetical protein n=1 Tax=Rhodoferax fermentans TaxID=28066 RepID=UPI00117AEF14|nr:hypothetical protein [Rhodoferax fermentans]
MVDLALQLVEGVQSVRRALLCGGAVKGHARRWVGFMLFDAPIKLFLCGGVRCLQFGQLRAVNHSFDGFQFGG